MSFVGSMGHHDGKIALNIHENSDIQDALGSEELRCSEVGQMVKEDRGVGYELLGHTRRHRKRTALSSFSIF